jgi:hypothetical protein
VPTLCSRGKCVMAGKHECHSGHQVCVVAGAHSCELHMGGGYCNCWYAHCARIGIVWRVICARLWLSTSSHTLHPTDARCDTCVFPPSHTFLWNTMWAQNRPLSTLVQSGWVPRAPRWWEPSCCTWDQRAEERGHTLGLPQKITLCALV